MDLTREETEYRALTPTTEHTADADRRERIAA
jgi:hypothetical protein